MKFGQFIHLNGYGTSLGYVGITLTLLNQTQMKLVNVYEAQGEVV